MSKLTDELANEHKTLLSSLSALKDADPKMNGVSEQLQAVKALLLKHLRKENEELYSMLREASFNNLRLQQKLDVTLRDVARLSSAVVEFLDTYSRGGSSSDFKRDADRLLTVFSAYIKREEELLFAEYLRITASRAA